MSSTFGTSSIVSYFTNNHFGNKQTKKFRNQIQVFIAVVTFTDERSHTDVTSSHCEMFGMTAKV